MMTPRPIGRRLSDHTIRTACLIAALAAIAAIDVWPLDEYRWPRPIDFLAVLLQTGIGLVAALLLERAFGRRCIGMGIVLTGIILAAAFVAPREFDAAAHLVVWSTFMMLLMLAAIDAVPRSLYEAAAVDRAGAWFVLGNVTMPLIAPLLLGGVVFRLVDTFKADRDRPLVFLMFAVLIGAIGFGEVIVRVRDRMSRGSSR